MLIIFRVHNTLNELLGRPHTDGSVGEMANEDRGIVHEDHNNNNSADKKNTIFCVCKEK